MSVEIIQIVTGFVGSVCFAVLFNMKGSRLVAASIGGLLSWTLFVLFSLFIPSEPMNYFFVAVLISVYAEVFARVLKTPATPLITVGLLPLIPGGSLYRTFGSAFDASFGVFSERAFYTLKLAAALALGTVVVVAFWRFFTIKVVDTRKRHNAT